MTDTAWIVGSVYLAGWNFEVNGVNKAVPAGHYYLRHATTSLSLVDTVLGLIQEEAGGCDLFVTEGRHVRLEPQAAQSVSLDWLAATSQRNLLGFTGNRASSDVAETATNISTLLLSPGYPATPATVLGTAGYVTNDSTTMISADGTTSLTNQYYEQVHQDLSWSELNAARMRADASANGGGTFHELHEQSLKLGYSLRYYETIDETEGSDTAVTWNDAAINSFGPYRLRRVDPRWYQRVVSNADLYSPLDLPLMQVNEYS